MMEICLIVQSSKCLNTNKRINFYSHSQNQKKWIGKHLDSIFKAYAGQRNFLFVGKGSSFTIYAIPMKQIYYIMCSMMIPKMITLFLITQLILKVESSCRGHSTGYWRCRRGYYNWPSSWHHDWGWVTYNCWENNGGSYWYCWDPDGNYAQYGLGSSSYDGYSWTVYRKCHWWCTACDGSSNPTYNCQSCRSGTWRYVAHERCNDYCPNEVNDGWYGDDSVGEYKSSNNWCAQCDSRCTWCDGSARSNCYACRTGGTNTWYLLDDYWNCYNRFKDGTQAPEHSVCSNRECYSTANACPSKYYYKVPQSSMGSNPYLSWGNSASASNLYSSPSNLNYRRYTAICYFCDEHCDTCTSHTQYDCSTCSRYNYMWAQRSGYCYYSCPMGRFGSGWVGQYIDETANTLSTGMGTRVCLTCQSRCVWCKLQNDHCLYCKDTSYLMDLNTECVNRFIADSRSTEIAGTVPECTRCQHSTFDMCNHASYDADNDCVASCPTYLYFPTTRCTSSQSQPSQSTSSSQFLCSYHTRYQTINTAVTETYFNTSTSDTHTKYYRRYTNMCRLCDYRCVQCTGPLNVHCSKCANFYYKWQAIGGVTQTVCDEECPDGQYIALDNTTTWANQTQCNYCNSRCELCEIYSYNCSDCVDYPSANTGYLYAYNNNISKCLERCEVSADNQTEIGYYGSIQNMYCYPCPSPCSNCDIDIILDQYPDLKCDGDQYCTHGIVCTSCLLGYVVVGGQCISEQNCRQYAYYNESDSAAEWSAENCLCLQGYSSNSYAKCDIRCHLNCKTCDGTGSTDCTSCNDGYTLSGGTCNNNNTNSFYWQVGSSWSGVTVSSTSTRSCGGYTSLFGYENQDGTYTSHQDSDNKYFKYSFSLSNNKYYAFQVRMQLLFIDEFDEDAAIYVSRDSTTNQPEFTWNFDTQGAYGEMLCGDNRMDYVMTVTAEIPSRNYTSQNFYITSNEDLIENQLGYILHWGLYGIKVTALKCHADCNYCTGPTQNDCISCSTTGEVAVDGVCVCDRDSNYYHWPTDSMNCHLGCPSNNGWFTDYATRTCVQPPTTSNCTAPNRFGNGMATSGYGNCVASCPGSLFASEKIMKCTSDCAAQDQYKYAGATYACVDVCPAGLFKDPSTGYCKQKCPTNYYLEIENRTTDPICTDTCVDWEYAGLQICVEDCPSDYFKQVIGGHNKCVATCTNAYADLSTGQCVTECPFPTYADPENMHCVDTCSDSSYFMQVNTSNLNRTCVTTCADGQYGNPFTRKCSNYTTECPDGYYADSHTNMCESTCSQSNQVAENSTKACLTSCLTGFAYSTIRACVQICPSTPKMFGRLDTKQCVSSCNHASTGLYGDAQANRTCVATCADTPVSTYGDDSSSECVQICPTNGEYGDAGHVNRRCVTVCSSSPQRYAYGVTRECLLQCPDSYYKDIDDTFGGRCLTSCPSPLFADPVNNTCRAICKWGWWGLPTGIRPCVQTCPYDWFAINITSNRLCVTLCDDGYWGDLQTSMCYDDKTLCSNDTYADPQKRLCVINTNCTEGTYADPYTKGCQETCSNGLLKDDNINTCVEMCSDSPDEYNDFGTCVPACANDRYADWQYRTCRTYCSRQPLMNYGVVSTHRCVLALDCPTDYYGDNVSRLCVDPCTGDLPFGDTITKMCVSDCPDGYWGDWDLNLCVDECNFGTLHYADNETGNCETLCTEGTFGVNATTDDISTCEHECPEGSFARDHDRVCVSNCQTDLSGNTLYGDPITRKCYEDPHDCSEGYYGNSVSKMCVVPDDCQTNPTHFYADDDTKECIIKCEEPYYGDQDLWMCVQVCPEGYFGENTTRICVDDCSSYDSLAEDQNNLCVARCSDEPVRHFGDWVTHTCVEPLSCSVDGSDQTYARNQSQECETECPTGEWADPTTLMCVEVCPNGYYGDDSSGKRICQTSCDGVYRFRDNYTKTCVDICPEANSTFGDSDGDKCVPTCPQDYFAQVDTNRRCVDVCKAGTWGNEITRICITDPFNECPPDTWADNSTHLCTDECSSTSNYYGNNLTKMCITACPEPSFAYDLTRVCIDVCPASLTDSGYFGDPDTTPTRKCFKKCQTSGLYRDPEQSRTCVQECTFNDTYHTYKDSTTMSCEAICSRYPEVRYADDNLKSCELACAGDLKKDEGQQKCVDSCTTLYDATTDRCVESCPRYSTSGVLYADMDSMTCVTSANCPADTYGDADNNLCTDVCPEGTYIHGKECVYTCPHDYFYDDSTQTCVIPEDCPDNQYADNRTRSCVSLCLGSFADDTLKRCIDVCYGSLYGDPFTHKCQDSCSNGLHINTNNHTCEADCNNGTYQNPSNMSCSETCPDPYFADQNLRACVEVCSSNPMTFSVINDESLRVCVETCPTDTMHDVVNRKCVEDCPTDTYAYTINMSCVAFCPGPTHYQLEGNCVANCSSHETLKYADETTRLCVSSCPTGTYKDDLSYKCVETCPTAPVQYYISVDDNKCVTDCPEGTYADRQELLCVEECSLSPRTFAEEVNNLCVEICPLSEDSFADPTSGNCVTECPSDYYADSRDRTCKQNCSFLFADSETTPPACVDQCTEGTFADELSFECVGQCPASYYAHTPTRTCVQFCPFGYFADTSNKKCVVGTLCPSTHPYADSLTHLCSEECSHGQWGFLETGATYGGECVDYCPDDYFSNPLTQHCETSCPDGLFAETNNNTCEYSCPYDTFMDSVNNQCVDECPAADGLFGDLFNRSCVTQCDPEKNTYADDQSRLCERTCTGDQYADDDSQTCVGPLECPASQFSDPHYKRCVDVCYNGTFGYEGQCIDDCPTDTDDVYASQDGDICVSAMDCPDGTYGDPVLHKCVEFCPIESATFAHDDSKKCLYDCPDPLYADNISRVCAEGCPDVPQLFAENDTNMCVEECPYLSFADTTINVCVQDCPDGYFADQSSLKCVQVCPEGKYGNNITNYCVDTCPENPSYFGDPQSRMCVLYCDEGKFADPDNNRECQGKCIGNVDTYAENDTNECLSTCLTGFSNERTKQCIEVCTAGYYGHNKVCYTDCPSANPTVYADDSTNLCKSQCPDGTFADPSTLKCVEVCPLDPNYFGNTNTKKCVPTCDLGQYADESTRLCVETCPEFPALFAKLPERTCIANCTFGLYADNETRSCKNDCPDGTYADSHTMRCVFNCPLNPLTYGLNVSNVCVDECPNLDDDGRDMYSDNATGTCVYLCTEHTFADPETRQCVTTCPEGYYAVNDTRRCQPNCPENTFADHLLRICVEVCSVDPIFYGDPYHWTCVEECPDDSYGNPLTQQCVYDEVGASTCPEGYYADPTTVLCVPICPMIEDLYGDPNTIRCQSSCTNDLIADNSTMTCVDRCPEYPSYFADLDQRRCKPYCPEGTFADNSSRQCVEQCPEGTYAENHTNRCVEQCQQEPLGYADNDTWQCVEFCPDGYFADNSTLKCVQTCPQSESTFGFDGNNTCMKVCPSGTYAEEDSRQCEPGCEGNKFADDSTNMCVEECPKYPPTYADPTTNQCVEECPTDHFSYEDNRTCLEDCPEGLYRQNSTSSCVSFCEYGSETFADNETGYCVFDCSPNSWADPTIHVCVDICPDQPLMYADDSTWECVERCPGDTYGENTTRSCVDECPENSLSLPQLNLCVRYCPIGYFAYNSTAFCVQECPDPYYGDPSTRSCVDSCPISQLLYADDLSRQCVKHCPDGSYADKESVSCVDECPNAGELDAQTYAADYNNVCVEECSMPYYADIAEKKCVTVCPDGYYNDITDHICHECPDECTRCSTYDVCTSCAADLYLENGQCVDTCSTGYYARNSTMTCVSARTCRPQYGVNDTHTCEVDCPVGSYKNNQMYRCDACQETCTACSSWTYCTDCIDDSVMFENYCWGYCSTQDADGSGEAEIYFDRDNETCVEVCPNNTYLSVVFCKPCAQICQNCYATSTNCTRCANGLYLENQVCRSSCSQGFRPNTTLHCDYCGNSCGQGLTFETNITTIDGQSNIYMTFSEDIVLNGNVEDIIGLEATSRRRVLAQGYRIEVVDENTIRIIIEDGGDASNYQVLILQPENLQDIYGNLPSVVRDDVEVDRSDIYSTTMENAPAGFSTYLSILAAVCVITFLFDLQLMKFLQIIYIHYFVGIVLPPQLSKVLLALRWSTLDYLPELYPIPEVVLRETVQGKYYDAVGDFSFLRNAGFAFTPLAVIILAWIIMKILSIPEINKHKKSRGWCADMLEQKFKYAVLMEWMSIVFLNTVFFIFLQMRDYEFYDTFAEASIFTSVFTLFFFVLLLVLICYKIISFFVEYPKLSDNLKKATDIILQEGEYQKMNSANVFMFELKKIDLRNILYPKVNNQNILPFRMVYRFTFLALCCVPVTFLRALILSCIIALGYRSTLMQMSLCIVLNTACLLYFSRARPYSFKFKKRRIKNYIAIFNEVALIIFEFLMLVLAILNRDKVSNTEKEQFSKVLIVFITIAATINFIYFLFRLAVQIYRKIYMPFTETELFRVNFPQKYAELHGAKQKKLLKGVDPKAKEALRALIKGYKKHKSELRPTDDDKANPQLPMKYKITYFDRDSSSIGSRSSMTKGQRRRMLKQLFQGDQPMLLDNDEKAKKQDFEQVMSQSQNTEAEFQEYEEEIEIKAKDLAKYVKNADELLRLKKMKEQDEESM